MHSRLKNRLERLKERGQASVMIGVMMSTFLFFFAFVVNTGMLVNAKINLQNAADLAAYAGAAVQARQLTQISYLNYEMRRQYKKFLFRYYVVGNFAQAQFPRAGGGNSTARTRMVWSPDGNPINDYGVPVVCLAVQNKEDNVCQLKNLPRIPKVNVAATDPITSTLQGYLDKLESIRQDNCTNQSATNIQILHLWLWNTDPEYAVRLSNSAQNNAAKQVAAIMRSVAMGLGLVPREIILRSRIKTLETYLNTPPLKGLTLDQINTLKDGGHLPEPPQNERAIQAFLSAYFTLGNNTFSDSASILMDELTPQQVIKLNDIPVKFDTYAVEFTNGGPGGGDCIPRFVADTLASPLPIGVWKDPDIQTYYALRLQGKARLLFNPFGGELTLRAYAAAKPFGSRIGPRLDESHFVRKGAQLTQLSAQSTADLTNQVPNLALREEEIKAPASAGTGWDTREAMASMYAQLANGAVGGAFTINEFTLARAYHAAMAPNHGEGPLYNIPSEAESTSPFVRNFDSNRVMAFWAPIFPLSKLGQSAAEIESLITQYFKGGNPNQAVQLPLLKQGLSQYFAKLNQGQGEQIDLLPVAPGATVPHAEGFRIARVTDPIRPRPRDAGGPPKIQVGGFTLNNAAEMRTSWNDVNDAGVEAEGRVGYSVKFVSFESLMGGSRNRIPLDDPDLESDLQQIQH